MKFSPCIAFREKVKWDRVNVVPRRFSGRGMSANFGGNMKPQGKKVRGVEVYVRHQDITKEIIAICTASKPKDNCKGIFVAIPGEPKLMESDKFYGGWAMITGCN